MYLRLTGNVGPRNPFYGHGLASYAPPDAYDTDIAAQDKFLKDMRGLDYYGYGQGDAAWQGILGKVKWPIVKGLVVGLATYATARAMAFDPKQATRLGLVLGGIEAASQLLGGYLRERMAQTQQVATTQVVTTPPAV